MPRAPFVFIAVVTLLCAPQSCINLCIVQMLLSAVPERGRSLIVSLYILKTLHPDIYAECSSRTTYKRFSVV